MMYLKKIWINNYEEHILTIEEAQNAIADGKEVCVAISKDECGCKTSFGVKGVREISVYQNLIIVRDESVTYPLNGWDNNIRVIQVEFFMDYTSNLLMNLKDAKVAVSKGHDVRACSYELRTSRILRFEEDNKFVTKSGSVYEMK